MKVYFTIKGSYEISDDPKIREEQYGSRDFADCLAMDQKSLEDDGNFWLMDGCPDATTTLSFSKDF